MRTVLISLSAAVLLALVPAFAAPQPQNGATLPPQAAAAAPAATEALPTRVGRVSLSGGKAEWRGGADGAWTSALVNDPVWTGSALRTDPTARAAIDIDAAAIRLAGATELDIAKLRSGVIDLTLAQGRIGLTLYRLAAGEGVEIGIARGEVRLLEPGTYDIDAGNAAAAARISVFKGSAHFVGGGVDTTVKSGEAAMLNGSNPLSTTIGRAATDAFAEWCRGRDRDEAALVSPYHIATEMAGYAALDAAGSWRQSGTYGWVWFPRAVPANWAPYRDGHWLWAPPWGWTWIDDMSWGFAPSHYGRWVDLDNRWGWAPGKFDPHPAYAPAVVAFLGTAGIGLSVAESSVPAVAWFPLAPGEVYWPRYTADLSQIRALNRATVAGADRLMPDAHGGPPADIVNGTFANRRFASAVPRPAFVAGKPVAAALLQLPEPRLLEAPVLMGSPEIGPPAPKVAVAAPPKRLRRAAEPVRRVAVRAAKRPPTAHLPRIAASHLRVPPRLVRPIREAAREPRLRAAHFRAPGAARRPLPHRLAAFHVTRITRRPARR